jgi:UDP-N-acetyl-D-galactosamine dehydrogenase
VSELQRRKMNVHIYDPVLNHKKIQTQHPEFKFLKSPKIKFYEAIIVAVAHDDYKKLGSKKIKQYAKDKHILFDLKSLFSIRESDLRL